MKPPTMRYGGQRQSWLLSKWLRRARCADADPRAFCAIAMSVVFCVLVVTVNAARAVSISPSGSTHAGERQSFAGDMRNSDIHETIGESLLLPFAGTARESALGVASLTSGEYGIALRVTSDDLHQSGDALIEYTDTGDDMQTSSISARLRSLVNLTGEAPVARSAPVGSRRPARAASGADPLLAMLQPLANEVLDLSLSQQRLVDGKVAFSLFGAGTFVLNVARDGSGLALAERSSGARVVFDDARVPSARDERTVDEQRNPTPANWPGASADDSPGLSSLLNSGITFFGWTLKGVSWLTQSPLMILLLLLAAFFYEIARRSRLPAARDSTPGPPPNAEPATAAAPLKRRRGRRGSRRGGWRKLIRQVRTSLGFPTQEVMREKDFSSPRRRRGGRRGTWRALVRQVSAALGFPGKEMLREKDFSTPRRRRSRRH